MLPLDESSTPQSQPSSQQPQPQTAPSQIRYLQIMICTCVRTCRRCDHQGPPSRPGRSELGWPSSRPSIPQEPVPQRESPSTKEFGRKPRTRGRNLVPCCLTQEEQRHRRSHARAGPTQTPPLPGRLGRPVMSWVLVLHRLSCIYRPLWDLVDIAENGRSSISGAAHSNVAGASLGLSHPREDANTGWDCVF